MQLLITLDQAGHVQIQVNTGGQPPDRDLILRMLAAAQLAVLAHPPANGTAVEPADQASVEALLRRLGRPPAGGAVG